MQGSFWKTVALVAVIGVGSLAILEVQSRLKRSPSVLEASAQGQQSLDADLKAATENSVAARLTDSDFEKMLTGGFAPTESPQHSDNDATFAGDLDLSEPPIIENSPADQSSEIDSDFFAFVDQQSQPSPAPTSDADKMPDLGFEELDQADTEISTASLTESPNPFTLGDEKTVATSETNPPDRLKPVSYVEGDSQTDAAPAFEAFPMGDTANATEFLAETPTTFQPSNDQEAASLRSGQMEFFNGGEAAASAAANSANATANLAPAQTPLAAFGAEHFEEQTNSGMGTDTKFADFPVTNPSPSAATASARPLDGMGVGSSEAAFNPELRTASQSNPADSVDDSPFFQPDSPAMAGEGNDPVPLPRDEPSFRGDLFPRDDLGISIPDSSSGQEGTFAPNTAAPSTFDHNSLGTETLPFTTDGDGSVPILDSLPDNGRSFDESSGGSFPGGFEEDGSMGSTPFEAPDFDRQPTDPRLEVPSDGFGGSPFPDTSINPSHLDSNESGFGNNTPGRSEFGGVNPRFHLDRDRGSSINGEDGFRDDLASPDSQPLIINPGFGSSRTDFSRRDRRNNGGSLNISEDRGSGPIREFGSSDRFPEYPAGRDSDVVPFDGDSRIGSDSRSSRPLRRSREFGGSGRDEYRSGSEFESGSEFRSRDIHQVSSVMRPKLTLEKSAPENATVGTPLQYSITIRNDGDAPAYDVIVEDEVTESGRVDAAKPQADRTRDGERLIWEFDRIAPGTKEEILVQVTPTGEGVIDGVATVKFKSRIRATTKITAPRLELRMDGPAQVRLGDKVDYRYTIKNEGSGEAQSVFVRTVLPQNGGLRHPQGQDLEYEIPVMAPGEQRTILLSVVAAKEGDQQAAATVSSRNGSKAQSTWSTNVVGAQLQMVRRGPKRRYVSREAKYENMVTNETDFTAVNARVVEQIPPGMNFKTAGQNGRYDPTNRTVTWEIRRLAARERTNLQLVLEPRIAGQQDSKVTIFENIGAQSDDYISTTVVEDLHNVSATTSQLDGPVALGEVFGFSISVDNLGTADATDIQLHVEVPDEMEIYGAGNQEVSAGKLKDSNTVVFQKVVRIKPDEHQNFELKLRGIRPGQNKMVKARIQYSQMSEPLEISQSVTIYDDRN